MGAVQGLRGLTLCGTASAQAIQATVRQAMGYIDGIEDKETRISLIKTLQAVTEGKVSQL